MKTVVYTKNCQVFRVPFNSEKEAENFAKTKEYSSIDLFSGSDASSKKDKIIRSMLK